MTVEALGEKWRAVRQRVEGESRKEAIYRRLNERFYTRLSELGINPPIGPEITSCVGG